MWGLNGLAYVHHGFSWLLPILGSLVCPTESSLPCPVGEDSHPDMESSQPQQRRGCRSHCSWRVKLSLGPGGSLALHPKERAGGYWQVGTRSSAWWGGGPWPALTATPTQCQQHLQPGAREPLPAAERAVPAQEPHPQPGRAHPPEGPPTPARALAGREPLLWHLPPPLPHDRPAHPAAAAEAGQPGWVPLHPPRPITGAQEASLRAEPPLQRGPC